MSTTIILSYGFYYSKTCSNQDYYEDKDNQEEYEDEIMDETKKMIWVLFMILAIILFSVGCVMIRRLSIYYKDFYKDFSC